MKCNECGHIRISYNSCRNRHCSKCQSLAREKWIEERTNDLLPIPYFHVVFTLPADLIPLVLRNKKLLYSLLFKASSETLLELTKDPKHLGAHIGFISILHTWVQNLMDHPHVHCIVTGGGLSFNQQKWCPLKKKFFLPVKVMSSLFRGKFLDYLKKEFHKDTLDLSGQIQSFQFDQEFQELIDTLYKKD